jgi:hypothetical protein
MATPSWETLQRLAMACGRLLKLDAAPLPHPDDAKLAEIMLEMEPDERLQALRHYARLAAANKP